MGPPSAQGRFGRTLKVLVVACLSHYFDYLIQMEVDFT